MIAHGLAGRPSCWAGAFVAGRTRDKHAGVEGAEEGEVLRVREVSAVPIEKLMTSTPSATAASIAATESEKAQPACGASGACQQALYMAMRARGAMPLTQREARAVQGRRGPCCRRRSSRCACRGRRSRAPTGTRRRRGRCRPTGSRSTNQRAPISLLLQSWSTSARRPGRCRPSRRAGAEARAREARVLLDDAGVDVADDHALARQAERGAQAVVRGS